MKRNLQAHTQGTLLIALAFSIVGAHQLFGTQQAAKGNTQPLPRDNGAQIAVVTDVDGMEQEVSDLTANYSVPGYMLGGPKPKKLKTIVVVLAFREGHVWTHEELNFPFASIRSIDLRSNRLEMRDGSLVSWLWESTTHKIALEQTDAAGKKKRTECDAVSLEAGELEGKGYALVAFEGRGRGASGREGSFYVLENQVRRIEFRQGRH